MSSRRRERLFEVLQIAALQASGQQTKRADRWENKSMHMQVCPSDSPNQNPTPSAFEGLSTFPSRRRVAQYPVPAV